MYRVHPMGRIAALSEIESEATDRTADNIVEKFLARYPEVRARNEAVTASWNHVVGAASLAVMNSEIAEANTDDCCGHISKSMELLATAGEYTIAVTGVLLCLSKLVGAR